MNAENQYGSNLAKKIFWLQLLTLVDGSGLLICATLRTGTGLLVIHSLGCILIVSEKTKNAFRVVLLHYLYTVRPGYHHFKHIFWLISAGTNLFPSFTPSNIQIHWFRPLCTTSQKSCSSIFFYSHPPDYQQNLERDHSVLQYYWDSGVSDILPGGNVHPEPLVTEISTVLLCSVLFVWVLPSTTSLLFLSML